jgi:hypothetical protein
MSNQPGDLREEVAHEVMAAAHKLQQQHAQDVPGFTAPAAVIACSAVTGAVPGEWQPAQLGLHVTKTGTACM